MGGIHPIYGLNPCVYVCRHCGIDEGLYFLGDALNEKSPAEKKIECFGFCKNNNLVILIEVDNEGNEVGYRVIMKVNELLERYGLSITPGYHNISTTKLKKTMGTDYRRAGAI